MDDALHGPTSDARRAHARGEWQAAFDGFVAAGPTDAFTGDDLRAFADSAWWLGRMTESLDAYGQANRRYVAEGRPTDAAMAAFYMGLHTSLRGDIANGNAWLRRCDQLLAEEPECNAHGYPRYWATYQSMGAGDYDTAMTHALEMQRLGKRWSDPSLVAVGTLGEGRTLIKQGQIDEGLLLLDDAMLAASSGEINPFWAGAIYCHLMSVCHELLDLRRATEFTRTAEQWCRPLPDANLYPGICRVHRAQVLQLRGSWDQAVELAVKACSDTEQLHLVTAAEANYQIAEIRRLRGDFTGAEESLKRAHEMGGDVQPGLALLRLAQGRVDLAAASIRAALAGEQVDRLARARLNAAQVEIALADDDLDTARTATAELEAVADYQSSSGLAAAAQRARGALLLAEGDAAGALRVLWSACRRWLELDAPYDAALTRVLLADVYGALGDADAVALELDAAATVFERLGARPDAQGIAERTGAHAASNGLSKRETEVVQLIAVGQSNRQIAAKLFLSERTVHRHVSNIFAKLGVSSRSAVTAFAYAHGLVEVQPSAG